MFVIVKWPRTAINSLNGFLLAAQTYQVLFPKEFLRWIEQTGHVEWGSHFIMYHKIVFLNWEKETNAKMQLSVSSSRGGQIQRWHISTNESNRMKECG